MNKYNAVKVNVDGITFDSKKEAERYSELKLLERCGAISDLELQVEYKLIPSQKICKKGDAYEIFKIKRKLMLERYGIRVREV